MPAAAWVTLIIAALIIAITAVGLLQGHLPSARDPRDPRGDHRRGAGRRAADQHGARPAHLGQRQPEAGSRLLRNGLNCQRSTLMYGTVAGTSTTPAGWWATRSAS